MSNSNVNNSLDFKFKKGDRVRHLRFGACTIEGNYVSKDSVLIDKYIFIVPDEKPATLHGELEFARVLMVDEDAVSKIK